MRTRLGCVAACIVVAACAVGFAAPRALAQAAPCAPGTPQALAFDGLRRELPFGPSELFSVTERFGDWVAEGAVTVRMAEGAKDPFFEGDVELDKDLYVQLDLDDEPVLISLTYQQRNETAEDAESAPPRSTSCTQTLSQQVRGFRRILLPALCYEGRYRPRQYIIACGDGNYRLNGLRWRNWDGDRASGSGTAWANDCVPYCAAGRFHKYGVQVRAYRIRRCSEDGDRFRYTRLRLHYPGSRPAYAKPTQILTVHCLSSDF
jgi:hypothetical protein